MLECLVIGGGPAGLLAAVYLGRYRRTVQVIDAGESRAAKIPESHNYPGFFGIAGPELLRRLNAQARQYGAEFVTGQVTLLHKRGDTFVATCSGNDVNARFILLATGLVDHCSAGDVVTDLHQLSVAFGHAAVAATDIHNRLPHNPR